MSRYVICSRCVMDTSDPEIIFNERGECNHCARFDRDMSVLPKLQDDHEAALATLVDDIKKRRGKSQYDCLIGLSGGWDSTYSAWVIVKELGLKAIAVHVDNGWNSELAVSNIHNVVDRLNIDLITEVLDWEEFKSLQVAFLKSGTPDIEIPSDHAIVATMHNAAKRLKVNTILRGGNFLTESVGCRAWSDGHYDWHYIRSINRLFGSKPLKTFPHRDFFSPFARPPFNNVKQFEILDYWRFDRAAGEELIRSQLGWRSYGDKHHESTYTKFAHGIYLMKRFGYDFRRTYLSSLVLSGIVTRDQAMARLQMPPVLPEDEALIVEYVLKKLDLTEDEYHDILTQPLRFYTDYPNVMSLRFDNPFYKSARSAYRYLVKPLISRETLR